MPDIEHFDEGAVHRIILTRHARANALSASMVEALIGALSDSIVQSPELLVIEGSERFFCAGFDLSELPDETDSSLLYRFVRIEQLLQMFKTAPFWTMAVARGAAFGAGADLFAACDIRLVDRNAVLAFPGLSGFGICLGNRRLERLVDLSYSEDWLSTGRRIYADEALGSGLASNSSDIELPVSVDPSVDQYRQLLRRAGPIVRNYSAADGLSDLGRLVESATKTSLHSRLSAYTARNRAARNKD